MSDTNPIVYKAHLHWVLFCGPIILLVGALFAANLFYPLHEVAYIVAGIAVVWGIMMWVTYHFSYLIIKRKQVILCSGILVRQTVDIPLNKIESVDIRQTIMGSILQYGSLVITGTGGTRQAINYLSKPLTCRRYIEQLMHQ